MFRIPRISQAQFTQNSKLFVTLAKKLEAYSEPYQIFALERSVRALCNPDIFRTFPYSEPEEYT